MGDTSGAAYASGGLRRSAAGGAGPMLPGAPAEDKPQPQGRTDVSTPPGGPSGGPPQMSASSLVSLVPGQGSAAAGMGSVPYGWGGPQAPIPGGTNSFAPGEPAPGTGMPGGGGAPGGGQDARGFYRPFAVRQTPGEPWSERDGQGNPSGFGRINGEMYQREGSHWVKVSLVNQYGGADKIPPDVYNTPGNSFSYSDGVTTMVSQQRAAQQAARTSATGFDSEPERQRRADMQRRIGVNPKSDENQDDPVFVAKQVLSDEIAGGHFDELTPGGNIFYSFSGQAQGGAWRFKDINGREFAGTPEMIAQAAAAQKAKDAGQGQPGAPGAPPVSNPNAVDVNGLPLAPGANAYGLPGAQVGWMTQAGQQSNYPYLARGAVAMPGSKDGVHVIMAEAGVPEVAVPVPKLRAVAGDEVANRVIQAVSHTVVRPEGQVSATKGAEGVPKLAAGALTMGGEGTAGSAIPNLPNSVMPGAGGPQGAPPPPTSSFNPNTVYSNPFGNGGSYTPFAGYTPARYTPYQERDMTDQEKAQLASISNIARTLTGQGQNLYQIGAPAYADAIKYYHTLLSGNRTAMQAATAGSAEAIRAQGRGLEGRITASLGRSGAADAAKAEAAQQEAAAIAHLTQGVQPAAAAALQQAGLEGATAGAGMESQGGDFYSRVQQALTQHRQFEENLGENSRQFGASFEEQSRQFGTQLTENSRQFAASLAEQVRQGNMSYQQAMASLALNDSQFQQSFGMESRKFEEMVRQFNEGLAIQKQQIGAQKSGAKGQAVVGTIGTIAMVAIAL